MIVLDIETGGLDPRTAALLSIGAVDFNNGEEFYLECHAQNSGELDDAALAINGFTREQAMNLTKPDYYEAVLRFVEWSKGRHQLLGGQQIGSFDSPWLQHLYRAAAPGQKWPFGHRTVDLHSIAYGRWKESLTMDGVLQKLGIAPEPKPHNALTGAKLEAQAFRLLLS